MNLYLYLDAVTNLYILKHKGFVFNPKSGSLMLIERESDGFVNLQALYDNKAFRQNTNGHILSEFIDPSTIVNELGISYGNDAQAIRTALVDFFVDAPSGGGGLSVEQVKSQSTTKAPSSKLFADVTGELELNIKTSIASLENTINSANINQETTATVSGVDTVALPKTAANTGMQVQLFGQSAQNLVNGANIAAGASVTFSTILNNKYYVSNQIALVTGDGNNYTSTNSGATAINIVVVNLTATFGAGAELTFAQAQSLFANYFEGVDNVLGTGRVRSVGNNIIKPTYIQGFQVSTTDGTFVAGATFSRSDYFRVAASTAYILSSNTNTGTDHRIAFYDSAKVFISGATQTSGQPINVTSPANAYYAIVSSLTTKIDTFRLTRGTASFEPYRESNIYLTTPELLGNGAIKDEIRKGTNGYELVKRVGVGTLTEKVTNAADREFSSDTGFWTKGAGITISGGQLLCNTTTNRDLTTPLVTGKTYVWKGELVSYTRGNPFLYAVNLSTGFATNIPITTTLGEKTIYFKATANKFFFYPGAINVGGESIWDNFSIKEVGEIDGLSTGTTFTEIGSNIHYTLATPVITPIPHAGLLNSNSNGTAYFEPIIADAGVYSSNLAIQLTDYPISSFESIRKYANGTYTELNTATAVIASGGLSFTHPDLVSGDLVMFTYAYNKESIGRSMTLTHYDSRFVEADTANGKVYRIVPVVTNGVVSWTAVEV